MAAEAPADSGKINDTTTRKPSRKGVLIVVGIVAVVVGIAWGVRWWTVGRFIETTDDAYLKADSVTVAPKVSGYVTEVLVADNQTVAAGAPVARLDTRQYQAQLDQAKATLDARAADILRAEAEVKQQQANAEQAKAQAEVSRVSLRQAEADVRRYEPLAASGAETAERLANLVSTRDQARATLAANLAAARSASTQIGATEAQIVQAKAQMEAAQAQLDQSSLDVHDTTLYSPLAGRVGDRSVRVGQYVQPGTRLMTIVPVEALYLEANFKGNSSGPHARRPAGHAACRRHQGRRSAWRGREFLAGHWRAVRALAAGKCHRQLHEDRAARAGAYSRGYGSANAQGAVAGSVRHRRCRHALRHRRQPPYRRREQS